jgi:hypothetical protein
MKFPKWTKLFSCFGDYSCPFICCSSAVNNNCGHEDDLAGNSTKKKEGESRGHDQEGENQGRGSQQDSLPDLISMKLLERSC